MTRSIDATPAIVRENYCFLRKSKKTLLIFRRLSSMTTNNKLELRHQRTGDVVFDWIDKLNPYKRPQHYVYNLIETLLPKAKMDSKTQNPHFKMLELYNLLTLILLYLYFKLILISLIGGAKTTNLARAGSRS